MTDPEQCAGRLAHAVERTRKRLQRALPLLREQSLQHQLDEVTRGYLKQLLGKAMPEGPLPSGLVEALQLLSSESINQELLTGFLLDVLHCRPLHCRPLNRDWLEKRSARASTHVPGFRASRRRSRSTASR